MAPTNKHQQKRSANAMRDALALLERAAPKWLTLQLGFNVGPLSDTATSAGHTLSEEQD